MWQHWLPLEGGFWGSLYALFIWIFYYEPQNFCNLKIQSRDFPGGAVVKYLPANAGGMGSSPGPGRSHMPRSN